MNLKIFLREIIIETKAEVLIESVILNPRNIKLKEPIELDKQQVIDTIVRMLK
jgi:hypothetical protein